MIPIVIRPIITEKSLKDASNGCYTFQVKKDANKYEIRNEVEMLFKVHVRDVTTLIKKGKIKKMGKKRLPVKGADIKKAKVRLSPGEKIDIFEVKPQ